MTRDTKQLSERASSAATRREELDRTMTAIVAAIADCFPTLKAKSNPKYFIDQIIKAERQVEWNQAMAKLVTWGIRHAILLEELSGVDPNDGELLLDRLEDALSEGFLPPTGRPRQTLNIEHDVMILLAEGVSVRSAKDANECVTARKSSPMTIAEAARVLTRWDRASLLPGQVWNLDDERHLDRARKRVLQARRLGDLDIVKGKPYGRSRFRYGPRRN